MILQSKVYDALKWIVMVMIPACTTAYVGLDSVFGWGYGDTVAKVSAIVCTLLGALLGISSAQYYKQEPPNE
jgi:hypothetical protein